MLQSRLEAGRYLEQGVLADMKGEPSAHLLKTSLHKLEETRRYMGMFNDRVGELRELNSKNEVIPEYAKALSKILEDHPPLERVSLDGVRFSNIARGRRQEEHRGPFGENLDEILANIQQDLRIVGGQLDETIDAFRGALPVAESGGFAALVLSGRAPLPEKIMQSSDLMIVYVQFYNRACMATIAADMHVYPKGLEWLRPASKEYIPRQGSR